MDDKITSNIKATNHQISFNPSRVALEEIKIWLQDEETNTGEGFFCNFGVIEDYFDRGTMAVISVEKTVIGFVVWWLNEGCTTIQITEIRPGYRRRGYGKLLVDALISKLIKDDISVVELHCQPPSSEKAWKKIGFKEFPDTTGFAGYNAKNSKHLYKILVPYSRPSEENKGKEVISLWGGEPHQTADSPPDWLWNITFEKNSRSLKKPIIWPAKRDWRIRWEGASDEIKDDKIKRFGNTDIDFGNFIIIKEL